MNDRDDTTVFAFTATATGGVLMLPSPRADRRPSQPRGPNAPRMISWLTEGRGR